MLSTGGGVTVVAGAVDSTVGVSFLQEIKGAQNERIRRNFVMMLKGAVCILFLTLLSFIINAKIRLRCA